MDILMTLIPGSKPGKVGKINVKVGDIIHEGDVLTSVETAKGNRVIKAVIGGKCGKITKVYISEGDEVFSNSKLFSVEPRECSVKEISRVLMSNIPGTKPGIVGKINVSEGDEVKEGDILTSVETSKGNRVIKANTLGTIKKIHIKEGDEVVTSSPLFDIELTGDSTCVNIETTINKTTKEEKTELTILGAGPGGYVAAIYAAKQGIKTTIIESQYFGGTCLNVGCIPTKSFVKSAEYYNNLKRANEFGIEIEGEAKPNMKKIVSRKNDIRDKLTNGIRYLLDANKVNVIEGKGYLLDKNTIQVVKDKEIINIKSNNIIISTGSKISKLPIKGLESPNVLNSTEALDLDVLPKSITIIGGGVIGMEFAFIYSSLGVKVNVVEYAKNILGNTDKEAAMLLTEIALNKGIQIYTDSKVKEIKQSIDQQAIVVYENDGEEKYIISENVLVAIGREPRLDELNLESLGIETWNNKKGVKVDAHMRTNIENIYAIGDVTNIIQLAHVASHQGIVAVDNILGKEHEMEYNAVPSVIFTMPEIATVGLTEDMAKAQGINYKVGRFSFQSNGKALTLGETEGFIKIISNNESHEVLGCTIIGPDASGLISTVTLAITKHLKVEDIQSTIFAHPTTSEVIHEAAMDVTLGAIHE